MSEQIIYGYKDRFSRFALVFTGIVFLVALNLIFLIWVKYPNAKRWYLAGLVVLGWVLWRMWRVWSKLHYIVTDDAITIVTPSGKRFVLQKSEITQIEKKQKGPKISLGGRGIKYIPRKHEVHFTTSTQNLHYITMSDGRVVVISPKIEIRL